MLIPPNVEPLTQTLDAIARADVITIGPGSLFTSLIPNVLVRGIVQAIVNSAAIKVFVCNLMTQANESLGLTAADHIRALNQHAQAQLFDFALINRTAVPSEMKAKYALTGSTQIVADLDSIEAMGVCPVLGDYLDQTGVARHATERVARDIVELMAQAPSMNRKSTLVMSGGLPQQTHAIEFAVYLWQMPKTTKTSSQTAPRVAIAIMAAGKGTRLKSKHPKVLHEVGGKPLLGHVIAAASQVVPAHDIFAIIGHEAERVREAVKETGIGFVLQSEQRGTGHALMVAREALAGYDVVIVLSGDAPLITTATIKKLQDFHLTKKAAMTLLTAKLDDPTGYGRVIRKGAKSDEVKTIVEQKALTASQKKIPEINAGFYAFGVKPLFQFIDKLQTNNAHGEFYLTDMASLLGKAKQRVVAVEAVNAYEVLGGNTRVDMAEIDEQMRAAKCPGVDAGGRDHSLSKDLRD